MDSLKRTSCSYRYTSLVVGIRWGSYRVCRTCPQLGQGWTKFLILGFIFNFFLVRLTVDNCTRKRNLKSSVKINSLNVTFKTSDVYNFLVDTYQENHFKYQFTLFEHGWLHFNKRLLSANKKKSVALLGVGSKGWGKHLNKHNGTCQFYMLTLDLYLGEGLFNPSELKGK